MIYDPEIIRAMFYEIKQVYFEGMCDGWLSDDNKMRPCPESPGLFRFEQDYVAFKERIIIRFVDSFFFHEPTDAVYGAVEIFVEGSPVWFMHYRGKYPQRAIPIVKQAMHCAFSRADFNGGRGTTCYIDNNAKLDYLCLLTKDEGFINFSGQEWVSDFSDPSHQTVIGYHEFWGGSLVHGPLL